MFQTKPLRKYRMVLLRISFVPLVFIALFVWRSWDDESCTDFVIEWAGYAFLIFGLGIRMWATLYIGQRKSKELITDGPFSICRNPLYIGTFAAAIGAAMCLENTVLLIAVLGIVIPVHTIAVLSEEAYLLAKFGDIYKNYKKSVPRFWFALSQFHTSATIEISTRSICRTARDAAMILLIPAVGDLIELLHAQGILPVIWHI